MSADHIPEVVLAFGLILAPGAGACLATSLAEGRPFVTFLALSFGIGVAIVAIVGLVLAIMGILGTSGLVLAWSGTVVVSWGIALRRGSLRILAHGWRDHVAGDPWSSVAVALTLGGVIVARWTVDPLANVAPTVLRYWADGLEISDGGSIPETTLQWGTVLPTAGSKVVLSAFDAAASTVLGRGPIEPLAALLFVVAIGLVSTAIAIFTELGMRRWAPLAVMLLLFTPIDLAIDLDKNLAENWGRLLAFAGVLVGLLAIRVRRTPEDGSTSQGRGVTTVVIAAVLLGLAAGTHLVAASVGFALLCSFALASSVVTRSDARRTLTGAAAMAGIAVVIAAAILALAPGELGFQGAVERDAYAAIRDELSLPPSFDPTLFIATNDMESPSVPSAPGVRDVAEQFSYRLVGANVYRSGVDSRPWLAQGTAILGLLLASSVILFGPPDLRVTALTSVIFAVVLFAIGVLFAFRYDLFALEFFGNRRLFTYAVIPSLLVAAGSAEAATRWAARRGVAERRASILPCALTILAAASLLPRGEPPFSVELRSAQLALVERIGSLVPCEDRVLATHRTVGTFETIAGHAGTLEGMGPHVRPSVLRIAIEEILAAQDFFADPAGGFDLLRERGIGVVLVARGSPAHAFGGYRIARVPADRLDQVPFLSRWFENEAGVVYRVEGAEAGPPLPRVAGRPGFDCSSATSANTASTRSTSSIEW